MQSVLSKSITTLSSDPIERLSWQAPPGGFPNPRWINLLRACFALRQVFHVGAGLVRAFKSPEEKLDSLRTGALKARPYNWTGGWNLQWILEKAQSDVQNRLQGLLGTSL
jgi:hypothetical protein